MTSSDLAVIGEALYGPRWQSDLARDLGVTDRTMRRWTERPNLPDGRGDQILKLCRARKTLIENVIRDLGGAQ